MAYFSTEPAPERRNVTGKNRVRDFFVLSSKTHPANRRQPAQPRRKISPTPTKSASGIPYWPSRDPIGERGGMNLYGFIRNEGIGRYDILGMFTPPDWFNFGVEARFVSFVEAKSRAFRSQSRVLALWTKPKCCSIHYQSKTDDGFVDIITDLYYYNPPPNFGEAFLDGLYEKLIEEATDKALEKAKLLKIVIELTKISYAAYQKSLPPKSTFTEESIVLGKESRLGQFYPVKSREWKTTSVDELELDEASCTSLNKAYPEKIYKY